MGRDTVQNVNAQSRGAVPIRPRPTPGVDLDPVTQNLLQIAEKSETFCREWVARFERLGIVFLTPIDLMTHEEVVEFAWDVIEQISLQKNRGKLN